MADKRMFSKKIIDSDAFLEMPQSAQLLYFHLSMRADDEGFVNNSKAIMNLCMCSGEDLRILHNQKFIIVFPPSLLVIKHWYINNYIRLDRKNETSYTKEKGLLKFKKNKAYELIKKGPVNQMTTKCQPLVNQLSTSCQPRLDQIRLEEKRDVGKKSDFSQPFSENKKDTTKNGKKIEQNISFENAWNLFGKYGNKKRAIEYWKRLSEKQQNEVLSTIPVYLEYLNYTGYNKKMFDGWINPARECWNTTYNIMPAKENKKATVISNNDEIGLDEWA